MKKILNIFIENIYKNESISDDELQCILENTKKMTDFALQNQEIYEKSVLNNYKFSTLCFDIVFCNDEYIHKINLEYRGKDRATDVISFAIFADSPEEERFIFDDEEINLGEIIISIDTLKKQALENNVSIKDELYFLISHGILHLFGFDHQTNKDYNVMISYQNEMRNTVDV